MVRNTETFEEVRINIKRLLRKRDREDLIPEWEELLGKFPDAPIDDKVPTEDVYGEIFGCHGGNVR